MAHLARLAGGTVCIDIAGSVREFVLDGEVVVVSDRDRRDTSVTRVWVVSPTTGRDMSVPVHCTHPRHAGHP